MDVMMSPGVRWRTVTGGNLLQLPLGYLLAQSFTSLKLVCHLPEISFSGWDVCNVKTAVVRSIKCTYSSVVCHI